MYIKIIMLSSVVGRGSSEVKKCAVFCSRQGIKVHRKCTVYGDWSGIHVHKNALFGDRKGIIENKKALSSVAGRGSTYIENGQSSEVGRGSTYIKMRRFRWSEDDQRTSRMRGFR